MTVDMSIELAAVRDLVFELKMIISPICGNKALSDDERATIVAAARHLERQSKAIEKAQANAA
jgi:hypothetical protein